MLILTQYLCLIDIKKLSMRKDPSHTRPLMIIEQDETVFKQYSFSQKCCVWPGGETQLLPKSDGYSRMFCGFFSRSFGVGLLLTQNELNEVHERRMGSEWGEYVSRESLFMKRENISDTYAPPHSNRRKHRKNSYNLKTAYAFCDENELQSKNYFPASILEQEWKIVSGLSAHMTPFKKDYHEIQNTSRRINLTEGSVYNLQLF